MFVAVYETIKMFVAVETIKMFVALIFLIIFSNLSSDNCNTAKMLILLYIFYTINLPIPYMDL
jgi:hypothetical protein